MIQWTVVIVEMKIFVKLFLDKDEEENEERKRPFKRRKTSLYSPFIKLNGGVKQEKSVASKNKRKFYN